MPQNTPKRKIKDSVFTNLFQDKKYLLRLYKALHPEDGNVTEEDIKDVTIKHILVDADYNDLGFSVGGRLVILIESQSTWTLNIIIRALMYLIQTYHDFFKRTKQNLYGSKKQWKPVPINIRIGNNINKGFLLLLCQRMAFWFFPIMGFLNLCHYPIRGVAPDISIPYRKREY